MTFDAGTVSGNLKFDLSEYTRSMIDAQSLMQAFPPIVLEFLENPMLAAIEVFKEAADSFVETIGEVAGHAQDIGLDAQKAGTSVQWLDNMSAAAKTVKVSTEQLTGAMEMLGRNAADALDGLSPAAKKAFESIGIGMGQLKELIKDPAALFDAVREGIAQMSTAGEKNAAAMNLMSRAGREMLPLLEMQTSTMQGIVDEHHKLGAAEDDASTAMGQKWAQVDQVFTDMWEGIKKALAEPILDAFTDHMGDLKKIAEGVSEFLGGAIPIALDLIKAGVVLVMPFIDVLIVGIDAAVEAVKLLVEAASAIDIPGADKWAANLDKMQDGLATAGVAMNDLVYGDGEPPEHHVKPGSPESIWKDANSITGGASVPSVESPSIESPSVGAGGIDDGSGGIGGSGGGPRGAGDGGIFQTSIAGASSGFFSEIVDEFRPMLYEIANFLETAIAASSADPLAVSQALAGSLPQLTTSGSSSSAGSVNIDVGGISVAGLDATSTADKIAQKITPQIRQALQQQQQAADAAARHSTVTAAVNGGN